MPKMIGYLKLDLLANPLPIGSLIWDAGWLYRLAMSEPYANRDKTPSSLNHWKTECADCGKVFVFITGAKVWNLARRCPECGKGKRMKRAAPFTYHYRDEADFCVPPHPLAKPHIEPPRQVRREDLF